MVSKARAKYVRISPKKLRLITGELKGQPAQESLQKLSLQKTRIASIAENTLKQAVANALSESNEIDEEDLFIKKIYVDKANHLPRFRAGAMGRYKPLKHRYSHLTIELDQYEIK
ncbi:MAG: 50S ribosomal protein L22 [Candidatus Zixiibacteriota bacterium]